jgi:hypothetical protein
MCVTIDGVWINDWIKWPLINSARNYKQLQRYRWSAHFAIPYTLNLLQPFIVFQSRCLLIARISEDSSASGLTPLLLLTNELIDPTVLVITSRRGPHVKHRFSVTAFVSVAAGTCLPSRCPGNSRGADRRKRRSTIVACVYVEDVT